MKCLIWFNRDLRLQDNQIFNWLATNSSECAAVIFVPEKKSSKQLTFFWESVIDLKKSLLKLNILLKISNQSPELAIEELVGLNKIDVILASKVYNNKNQSVIDTLKNKLLNTQFIFFEQSTLLTEVDLLFSIENMPKVFTEFRKKVEKNFKVKPLCSLPKQEFKSFELKQKNILFLDPPAEIENSFKQSCHIQAVSVTDLGYNFVGGESFSHKRINEYFKKTQSLSSYKETRNGMLEINESSKLSVWLAQGCISARQIYFEIKKYEEINGANESTYWLVFELLWRDYFKFLSLKIGKSLFSEQGLSQNKINSRDDKNQMYRWTNGQTGVDFVDANMRELRLTGWMSNRGRQNVASYFAKNENMNWTLGAKWFEENLIDDDTESNWGNWQYVSGAGTDPRDRVFNVERQAQMYDLDGRYRKKWLRS